MKFLSAENLKKVFSIVKGWIAAAKVELAAKVEAVEAKVDGLKFKTVNGEAITGEGNISIDLSLFKVVESLPTAGIDANKIYLVAKTGAPEGNVYTEHMYVNGKWEKVGEYSAAVDLTPYAKKAEVDAELAKKAAAADVYAKAETYSKTEVNAELAKKLNSADLTALTDAEIDALAAEALATEA